MADTTNTPVIFLAFANDRDDAIGYLRNLPEEARRLRDVLQPAEQAGLCEVMVRSNSTAADIFKVFQDPRYRNRVAILHYGGHANGYELLLESATGQAATADAGGLAKFLGQQQGLQLIFLNGCSTQQQTQGLLDANVAAVISTSRAIGDQVATDFSYHFYQGLGGGAGLQKAFDEAAAVVETTRGQDTRALYFGDATKISSSFDADRLPWLLAYRAGKEHVAAWNLPNAVDDPLFGLPTLPERELPESPYRHLSRFAREDAEVFFGRGHQIRELYDRLTAPRTAPITLFYGQSGVGKSSILDAGLIPRLEQDYEVCYLRRTEGGLLDTLQLAFLPEATGAPVESAWRSKEDQTGKPLIVFLDQVEELYTRPIESLPNELDRFLEVVKATFVESNQRPRGKLVLGFRKEWLAELESQLATYELPRSKVFLEPLDRRGIIEVVRGPAQTERLRERYGLTVEDGLAEIIADDLLADRDSAIAPTLQVLLTKMWTKATDANYEHPRFSQDLYGQLKRDGILLRDFLNQQIATFRQRYPAAVDSGLLLDIVALHTTPLGTADQRTVKQLHEQYAHLDATLPELLQQCQDLHLLTVATSTQKESVKTTRLAHDTLAPLVREQFDESDKPGQRARRILDNRSVDWTGDRDGTPLDAADLAIVEQGARGTRALTPTEQRLMEVSRRERRKRLRLQRTLQIASGIAVLLIAALAVLAQIARNKAEKSETAARSNLAVAREAVDEMLAKVGSESLKNVPQLEQIRTELLDKATVLYSQLSSQEGDSEAMQREQAEAHYSLGEIHRIMDNRAAAAREYQLAIDKFMALLASSAGQPQDRLDLAKSYNKFGYLLSTSSEPAEQAAAEQKYASALHQFGLLDDESQLRIECQAQKALTLNNRGLLRKDQGQTTEARRDFDDVIAMLLPFKTQDPKSEAVKECLLFLAYGYNNRAMLAGAATEESGRQVADYHAALEIAASLLDAFPKDRELQLEYAKWHNNLANAHNAAREIEKAYEHNRIAIEGCQRLAVPAVNVRSQLAKAYLTRAAIQYSQANLEEANDSLQSAKDIFVELNKDDPDNRDYKQGLAKAYLTRAAIQYSQANLEEANVSLQSAKDIFVDLNKDDPDNRDYKQGLRYVKMYEDMFAPPAGTDR